MRLSYQNPVWDGEFADPFVLRTQNGYYAYGTSAYARQPVRGSQSFPVLHCTDLVHWKFISGVIDAQEGFNYWAPAVAQRGGRFFLYYSLGETGDDSTHRLHVAQSDQPTGPFEMIGQILPNAGFSIDADPFCDPRDGRWYLFFCQDFFDQRVGTGIAAVPLADTMDTPADAITPILRASADWQIYERDRLLYGQRWPAWHTVEGPCVIWHDGLYYCLYSGGAWHSSDYGVSYGVAQHVLGPYRDEWSVEGPAVLRTTPGMAIGPGHNSVALGPDDRTDFIVYHAWDAARSARRMCIDPLIWTPDGPRCTGPTNEPQILDV